MKGVEGNEGVIQDGKRLYHSCVAKVQTLVWILYTHKKTKEERKRGMKCDAGRRLRDELDIDRTVGKI